MKLQQVQDSVVRAFCRSSSLSTSFQDMGQKSRCIATQALATEFVARQKNVSTRAQVVFYSSQRLAVSGTTYLVPADSPDPTFTSARLDIARLLPHSHQRKNVQTCTPPPTGGAVQLNAFSARLRSF